MIEFFRDAFAEVTDKGFDLASLEQIANMSNDQSLLILENQILNLKMFE